MKQSVHTPVLPRARPDDPAYQILAEREASYWREAHAGFSVEAVEAAGADTAIDRYTNERFTGDPRIPWYATIARRGDFRCGLALGTSGLGQDAHVLHSNPNLHLTFCDISGESLGRWERVLGARFPGRLSTLQADLNFLELPSDTYDLIVSSSTLHHVINLEHLAGQINKALTGDGLVFLQDFTGESMFEFPEEKRRIFEQLHHRDRERRRLPDAGLVWRSQDRSLFSPFCGVRSGDILTVMSSVLAPLEVRICGAMVNLVLHTRPADWDGTLPSPSLRQRLERRLRKYLPLLRRKPTPLFFEEPYLQELLFMDELVCDAGLCVPNNAFGVYRKRVTGGA